MVAGVFTVLMIVTLWYCIYSFISFLVPDTADISSLSQLEPLTGVFVMIIQALAIGAVIGLSPLYIGFVKLSSKIAQKENPPLFDIFTYFTSFRLYKKALHYSVAIMARYIGWGIVCAFPFTILIALFQTQVKPSTDMLGAVGINSLSILLGVASVALWVFVTRKYFMAGYLFVNDRYEYSSIECIKQSVSIMKKYRVQAAKLTLSFIPWFLLCFFVLPWLYVLPYYKTACSISAKWIYMMHQEEITPMPADMQIEGLQGES